MPKKIVVGVGLFAFVIVAILVVSHKKAQNEAFQLPVVSPIVVSAHSALWQSVQLTLPAQVTVKAEIEQLLTARMPAQVVSLPVREGDQVRAGDLLAQLDDQTSRAESSAADAQLAQYRLEQTTIRDQVAAAKLDVVAQQDTLNRLKKLASLKAASEDQIQQQRVRLAQAEQRLSAAQAQLKAYDDLLSARQKQAAAAKGAMGYVHLSALQDGVVSDRLVQEGDIVTAGTPLLRLVGAGGQRRLLVQTPSDMPAPVGLVWNNKLLPVTAWPRANGQGLLTYEARVVDTSLMPNQSLSLPMAIYAQEGIFLPSNCMIPKDMHQAQVLVDHEGKAKAVTVLLDAVGETGAVTQNRFLDGQALLCASSDMLIRILAGRVYQVQP